MTQLITSLCIQLVFHVESSSMRETSCFSLLLCMLTLLGTSTTIPPECKKKQQKNPKRLTLLIAPLSCQNMPFLLYGLRKTTSLQPPE